MEYLVRKRFRGKGIGGMFNLAYGTVCRSACGFLYAPDGRRICAVTSENGWEYFRPNTEEGARRQVWLDALYRYYEKGRGNMEDFAPKKWPGAVNTYWKNLLRTMPADKLEAFYRDRLDHKAVAV